MGEIHITPNFAELAKPDSAKNDLLAVEATMSELKDWEPVTAMEVGDKFTMYAPVLTKWNRFLYWLIKKPIPSSRQMFVVVENYSDAAKIIKPAICDS